MSGYKYVEFKCDGLRKGVACHGPGGPSLLVTIYNCLVLRYGKIDDVAVLDYVTEERMLAGIMMTLLNNIMTYERADQTIENYDDKKTMVLKIMDTLSAGFDVRPILNSIVTFEQTDGWWFFMFMGIPLLHGWVVDPKDKIIYDSVKMSSYDELVELLTKLESLKEESNSDVAAECALIQGYLDAAKTPSTSYGFASLCSALEEGEFTVFYWDGNFSVIHKKDGSLLTLETDGDFLNLFPQAIWRVFDPNQQGDGNRIYLTSQYGPAKNQPNTTKAIAWFREKLANKGKKTVEASSSVEPANKSGETEKNVEPAEKNVDTDISSGQLTRRQRRRNRKNKNIAPANKGVEAQEDANEAATPSHEVQGEALNTATPSLGETEDHLRVPANSPCPTEEQEKEGQANESVEKGGAQKVAAPSLVETKYDHPTAELEKEGQTREKYEGGCEAITSSQELVPDHSRPITKDNEENSMVVDDFLNFLCKFQDGRSKLKDGSRISYFEGIVEAMKHTGSPIFYVPYDFIMKYNKGLAIAIQDHYPRINGALRQSVVQYLVQQGLDLLTACGTELEILHLPEPKTVQSFNSFADNNVMLEDYYIYGYGLEESPSYVGRKMALGYLHRILNKFKTGRCWGGKWSESNMEVTDSGSNFVINCEDEELTPEAGLKDLQKFDETVLRRFKGKSGKYPPFYEEFQIDCLRIPDHRTDSSRFEKFLQIMSSPLLLKAPLVRSAFICNLYRAADSMRIGTPSVFVPLNVREQLHDWRNPAKLHYLLKKVYDYDNFANGPRNSSYVLDKWAVTHWDLLQFSRHFIEHVLRYTKKDNLVQQIQDVAIVDLMLSRHIGRYIAQLIRFIVCTCDIDGLFSSAWRHFVASECTDKPRKTKAGGVEDALSEEELVSSVCPEKSVGPETAWAYTEVGVADKSTLSLSHKSVLMGNVNLTNFKALLERHGVQVELQEDDTLLCGGSILVYKYYSTEDSKVAALVAIDGPLRSDYYKIFELLSTWMHL